MDKNTNNETFIKRTGTTDHGKPYEDLMTALLSLKLANDDSVDDFQLTANDSKFGNFDDIVFKVVKKDQSVQQYALQLKHKQNEKKITKDMLAGPKGDFSIQEYFESYQTVKANNNLQDNFICILYTCATFDQSNDYSFKLKDKNHIKVTAYKDLKEKFFLNTSDNNTVYKFKIKQDTGATVVDIQDYEEFFEHFFLYPNQKNIIDVQTLTTKLFQNTYLCEDVFFDEYVKYINKWSQVEGVKPSLNKKIILKYISEVLLKPYLRSSSALTKNSSLQLFQDACLLYDVIFIETSNNDVRKLFCEKDELSSQNFVIIEVIEDQKEKIYKAVNLAQSVNSGKKYVLIGDHLNKDKVSNVNVFQNLYDLRSNLPVFEKIVQNVKLSVQGRDPVTLATIIGNNEEMEEVFTTNELILMMISDFRVGEEKEQLPNPYIHQSVLDTKIDLNFINCSRSLSVISCHNNFEIIKTQIFGAELMTTSDYLTKVDQKKLPAYFKTEYSYNKVVIICENQCTIEDFRKICDKDPFKICHHFGLCSNGTLIWIASRGGIEELFNFRMPPIFKKESEIIKPFNNINVICGLSGIGKTIMLKYLKNNIPSTYWVLKINLRDLPQLGENHSTENVIKIFQEYQSNIHKFTDFENNLIEILWKNKRVVILFDGLDELSNLSISKVLSTFQEISNLGFILWITARPNWEERLRNKFCVFPLFIKKLDAEDQKLYIQKYFRNSIQNDENLEEAAKKIIKLLEDMTATELLGIPLQIYILTELFHRNPYKFNTLLKRNILTLTNMIRYFVEEKIKFCYTDKGNLNLQNPFVKQVLREHKKYKIEEYRKLALQTFIEKEDFDSLPLNARPAVKVLKDDFGIISQVGKNNSVTFLHNSFGEYFAATWFVKNFRKLQNFEKFFFKERYKNIRRMFDMILCKKCPEHLAVLHNNLEMLKQYGNHPAQKDAIGRNPLHLACSYGQAHPVLLVRKTPEPYIIDFQKGNSVLEDNSNYKEILICLLKRYDFCEKDNLFFCNSFEYAITAKSLFPVEIILSRNKSITTNLLLKIYDPATLAFYSIKFNYSNLFKVFENTIPYFESCDESNLLHQIAQWANRSTFLPQIFNNSKYIEAVNKNNRLKRSLMLLHFPSNSLLKNNNTVWSVETETTVEMNKLHTCLVMRETPLHLACVFSDYQTVKILVEHGADVNYINNNGSTPLHYATSVSNIAIVKLLRQNGARLNESDVTGENELHIAVRSESIELVCYLLQEGTTLVANKDKITPLSLAVYLNNKDIINILFKKLLRDHDMSFTNELCTAAFTNNLELVKYFIKNAVNLQYGADCLNITPLQAGVLSGNFTIIETLIAQKFDVNESSIDKTTPLHLAVLLGFYKITELLVNSGISVNKTTNYGISALHLSVFSQRQDITIFLLQNKANVDAQDKLGNASLLYAVVLQNKNLVEILLNAGANVKQKNNVGCCSLHIAASVGNLEILQMLLKQACAVDCENDLGGTPLYLAAFYGHLNAVKMLIQYGADVDKKDKYGISPGNILSMLDFSTSSFYKSQEFARNANVKQTLSLKISELKIPREPLRRILLQGCMYVRLDPGYP